MQINQPNTQSIIFENIEQSNPNQQLSYEFPNFVMFMAESSIYLQNVERHIDTLNKLEYKVPILTFGRTMGYDYYIIERDFDKSFLFYQCRIGKNGGAAIYSSKIRINGDLSMPRYKELFQEILIELMVIPSYRAVATSGF